MVTCVGFAKGVLDEIRTHAACSTDEVCGLLLGAPDRVDAVLHCRNVAPDPLRAFEIDPAELIAALRAERGGGPRVTGCYHSHPSGRAEPSPRDATDAAPNGWLWLIVAPSAVGLWRAVAHGAWHGRFEAIGYWTAKSKGPPTLTDRRP